jgi:MoxR-like ATPase
MEGRCYVRCHDVKALAKPVLRHRLTTNFNADSEGITSDQVISRIVDETRLRTS